MYIRLGSAQAAAICFKTCSLDRIPCVPGAPGWSAVSNLEPRGNDRACCLRADEHDLLGPAPETNLAAGDLDEVVEVGEVVLDQVEDLLLRLREPAKEIREGALRLGEELGQPAKQLREEDAILFKVVLRIDRESGLGAIARPQVLACRSCVVGGGRQGAAEIREERVVEERVGVPVRK